jgi:DNA-binding transcriptional MerR regulator
MNKALWTLDELAERVDAALSVGYDGQASGRVREVPDQRAIRYYTTLGLVDRPVARRGSTALYGPRHLLQLVAIKKLQARGLPLARIQVELAGATDQQLERIARVPRLPEPEQLVASPVPPYATRRRTTSSLVEVDQPPARPGTSPMAPGSRAGAFWKRTAAADLAAGAPGPRPSAEAPAPGGRPDAATLQGVRLADGVTLLLDWARPLRDDQVRAIQAAAEPLLEALRARGLGGRPRGREKT